MEGAVKKTKFVWSIILFILALVAIACAIGFALNPPFGTQDEQSMSDGLLMQSKLDSVFIVLMPSLAGSGFMCGAHFLYRSYSKARGKRSVGGKIYYWLTFILSVPIFILVGIFLLGKLIYNKLMGNAWDSTPAPSAKSDKHVINVNGYNRDIEWDEYTRIYRDTSGNHYVTKDGGKTFSKKN